MEGEKVSSELGIERDRRKKVKLVRKYRRVLAGAASNVSSRRES